jgi:hypothetical protein
MTALTERDERVLAGLSLAASHRRLERVARLALDRDDAVTELLRAAGRTDDDGASFRDAAAIVERRGGNAFHLLDLVTEISQQERERRGEPRTWDWPEDRRDE